MSVIISDMNTNRSTRRWGIIIGFSLVLFVLGFVVVFLLYSSEEREFRQGGGDEVDDAVRTDLGKQKKRRSRFPKIDKRTRAMVLGKILMALKEKRQIEATAPAEKSRVPGVLSQRYIGKKIIELNPLLKECYVTEMEDRGHVSGKVLVEIGFVGDDEYGGLVEEVKILESQLSRERSEYFLECLRESLYAIQLDAPEWGGRKTVKMPFHFMALGF